MERKVTIHDIAREAGVSAATVSYVINNREDQSISEETKRKIWHIINLFNYKPNAVAKNLRSTPESKIIAVCTANDNILFQAEYLNILKNLDIALSAQKYRLMFCTDPYRNLGADAIIAYNFTKENFYKIGEKNFIPLIAADCVIDDPLFFQINTDYNKIKQTADGFFKSDYTFVCIPPTDEALCGEIKNTFKSYKFVGTLSDLQAAAQLNNVLTVDKIIYNFYSEQNVNLLFLKEHNLEKSNRIVACIKQALSHEKFDVHSYKV